MRWKFDTNIKTRCDSDHQMAPYIFCVRSYIPKTEIPVFEDKGNGDLEFTKFDEEDNEGQDIQIPIRYQLPCKGDSGSSHWVVNTNIDRAVVIGMSSFSGDYRRSETIICGHSAHIVKTTWPPFLHWIKKHAGIVK